MCNTNLGVSGLTAKSRWAAARLLLVAPEGAGDQASCCSCGRVALLAARAGCCCPTREGTLFSEVVILRGKRKRRRTQFIRQSPRQEDPTMVLRLLPRLNQSNILKLGGVLLLFVSVSLLVGA